ncbi:MAG: hypothetical protein H8E44_02350 [Planctomycetes bacterium]|nr:hypothetical protein [Planctomycetota bacterium]
MAGPSPRIPESSPVDNLASVPITSPGADWRPAMPPATADPPDTLHEPPPPVAHEPAVPAIDAPVTSAAATQPPTTRSVFPRLIPWFAAVWLAGLVVLVGRLLFACIATWRAVSKAKRCEDASCNDLLQQTTATLGLRRTVVLIESDRCSIPLVIGVLRPRLILPPQFCGWPDDRRRVVMLHELAHIMRWDCLTKLFAQLVCAIHWFNPLVWFAYRRTQIEAEQASDDVVLGRGSDPHDYAGHLLSIASNRRSRRLAAATGFAMARPSSLEGRLLAILDSGRSRRGLTLSGTLGVVVLMTAGASMIASMGAADGGEEAPRENTPPSETATEGWGEPVEGVQVGLRAEKLDWKTGETPKFTTEVRKGERKITFGWGDAACELEFDSKWHYVAIDDHPVDRITLGDPWKSKEGNTELPLSAGKHTIRVAITGGVEGKSVRAVSNPIEITVGNSQPRVADDTERYPTIGERAAERAAPDLGQLVRRSKPWHDGEGADATDAFYDVLKLREVGNADAVPVLRQILLDNLQSGRIHGHAAAQALFCIGTQEAHQVLATHLLTGQYRAGQAIGYTFHWDMAEPQRSRFIEQCLLESVSEDLVVELRQQPSPPESKGQLDFIVTLRNTSQRPFHVIDRKFYLGKMLFFRTPNGQTIRSRLSVKYHYHREWGVDHERGPDEWIELNPGQTHQYAITVHVKPAAEIRAFDRGVSEDSVVLLESRDVRWYLGHPGRYEVIAMVEAAPLTDLQKQQVQFDNAWSGRAVSRPISIDIPERASESAEPLQDHPSPLDERPDTGKAGSNTTEVFPDIVKLREAGNAAAVKTLERVLRDSQEHRLRRAAAAQALFAIGTPQAHEPLVEFLPLRRHHLGLTVNYFGRSGWEMPEPERSRFIEQYLLKGDSQDLVVELESEKPAGTDGRQFDFAITLRNASDKLLRIKDPQAYLGRHLYLRDSRGRFARSVKSAEVNIRSPKWTELQPTQSRRFHIAAHVEPFDAANEDPRGVPESVAVLATRDVRYYLEATGPFQAVAMFEAAPLTEEEKIQLEFDNAWSGRAVSKPIQVEIPAPVSTPGPTESARPNSAVWSEPLSGLRVRVTPPEDAEYRKGQPLPLAVELQNVTNEPIPFDSLSPHGRIKVTDSQGKWLGSPWFEIAVSPWEGSTAGLAPQAILKWQVRFDRLRFSKPVTAGSTVHFQYSVPTQVEEPGILPRTSYSPPVAIKLKDVPPTPLTPEDLPERWTADMDLVYREFAGLGGPERRVHVDG